MGIAIWHQNPQTAGKTCYLAPDCKVSHSATTHFIPAKTLYYKHFVDRDPESVSNFTQNHAPGKQQIKVQLPPSHLKNHAASAVALHSKSHLCFGT